MLTRALSFITPLFLVKRRLPPMQRLVASTMCSSGMPHVFSPYITLLNLMLSHSFWINQMPCSMTTLSSHYHSDCHYIFENHNMFIPSPWLYVELSCMGQGSIKLTNVMKVLTHTLWKKEIQMQQEVRRKEQPTNEKTNITYPNHLQAPALQKYVANLDVGSK